jgi:osomolarity two-component system response regulator SKN7
LQAQVERLVQTQDDMAAHIRHLENNYQNVLTEMVNFQRNMAQQDGLMQNLISYFLQMENGQFNF